MKRKYENKDLNIAYNDGYDEALKQVEKIIDDGELDGYIYVKGLKQKLKKI